MMFFAFADSFFSSSLVWLRSDTYVGLKSSRVRVSACRIKTKLKKNTHIRNVFSFISAPLSERRSNDICKCEWKCCCHSIYIHNNIGFLDLWMWVVCDSYFISVTRTRSMLLLAISRKKKTQNRIEEMFELNIAHWEWSKYTRKQRRIATPLTA